MNKWLPKLEWFPFPLAWRWWQRCLVDPIGRCSRLIDEVVLGQHSGRVPDVAFPAAAFDGGRLMSKGLVGSVPAMGYLSHVSAGTQ